jgi:hypothetical protein
MVTQRTGYVSLPASAVATLAVHLVPLEFVPRVTMLAALAVQVLPALLLIVSGIPWLRHWYTQLPALLLLATPPLAEEVWLNTINSQFHVFLSVALILASVPGRRSIAALQGGVLLVAPLCGAPATTLLPLFLLRAWADRSSRRAVQALLLLPAAAVQVCVVLTHPEPSRIVGLDAPLVLAAITAKQILLPLLGPERAMVLAGGLVGDYAAGRLPMAFLLAPVAWFGTLAMLAWRSRDGAIRWLLAGAVLEIGVGYFGASMPLGRQNLLLVYSGMRYYFAPAVLTALTVLGIAVLGATGTRVVAGGLVCWMLLIGLENYQRPSFDGPSWRAEVAAWRRDPSHPIAVWPADWQLRLDRR